MRRRQTALQRSVRTIRVPFTSAALLPLMRRATGAEWNNRFQGTAYGRSLVGGGVDDGLMSLNHLSRSASHECESKGDDNESLFHGRIPSLTV